MSDPSYDILTKRGQCLLSYCDDDTHCPHEDEDRYRDNDKVLRATNPISFYEFLATLVAGALHLSVLYTALRVGRSVGLSAIVPTWRSFEACKLV